MTDYMPTAPRLVCRNLLVFQELAAVRSCILVAAVHAVLRFVPVERIEEVLEAALREHIPRITRIRDGTLYVHI